MAEMYVGDDVSPDFYGWVFPKYDHVGVGTGTVVNRPAIKDYQVGCVDVNLTSTRVRCGANLWRCCTSLTNFVMIRRRIHSVVECHTATTPPALGNKKTRVILRYIRCRSSSSPWPSLAV